MEKKAHEDRVEGIQKAYRYHSVLLKSLEQWAANRKTGHNC